MNKTLSTIMAIFKVAKIVTKIVFIVCTVGCALCLVSAIIIPIFGSIVIDILSEQGLDLAAACSASIAGSIACAGEAVCAYFWEKYFSRVINDKTPFTLEGSRECFNLGLICIISSLAVAVGTGMALAIALIISPEINEIELSSSTSLVTGFFLLFISLVFKHGAEVSDTPRIENVSEENSSKEEKTEEAANAETEQI